MIINYILAKRNYVKCYMMFVPHMLYIFQLDNNAVIMQLHENRLDCKTLTK